MAVLLRAQSLASYQAGNSGHFGLALKAYAHFTSPIRRYGDLDVHRAMEARRCRVIVVCGHLHQLAGRGIELAEATTPLHPEHTDSCHARQHESDDSEQRDNTPDYALGHVGIRITETRRTGDRVTGWEDQGQDRGRSYH